MSKAALQNALERDHQKQKSASLKEGILHDLSLMLRFLRYALRFPKQLSGILLLLPLLSVVQLLQPYVVKVVIDEHVIPKEVEGFGLLALFFLFLLSCEFILRYVQNFSIQKLGQKIMKDIRRDIFAQLLRLSTSYFEKNSAGKLTNRATNDVEALSDMVSAGIVALISDMVLITGIACAMFYLSPLLASITLTSFPVIIVGTILIRRQIRKYYQISRAKQSAMSSFIAESIAGMKEIHLSMREQRNQKGFNQINRSYLHANLSSNFYDAFLYSFVEVAGVVVVALILLVGSFHQNEGMVTIGIVIAFIEYINRMFFPIRDLSAKFAVIQSAMSAMEKIFSLIDEKPEIEKSKKLRDITSLKGNIVFKDVSFSYNEGEEVLKDISLTMKPGEKLAIVGHTGAGKSTLIKLLSRLYDVQKGMVCIDNIPVHELPIGLLRRSIGVVLQDVHLFSGSVLDNIRLYDKSITEENVLEALEMVGADSFIQKLPQGVHTLLEERGSNLSFGQRQLLSFARVIVRKPPIVILDEATSSIDNDTERAIHKGTERLLASRTAIIIAHRLATIQSANRIIVMHHGKIAEEGTHANLLARNGLYAKLYRLQFSQQ